MTRRLRYALMMALLSVPVRAAEPAPATEPAPAQPECQLVQLVSLEMSTQFDGRVAVPATIQGQTGLLVIDTGSIHSVLTDAAARSRNLQMRIGNQIFFYLGGLPAYKFVEADRLELGHMVARDMPLLILPARSFDRNAIGMLAPDIMSNYDVDFDFAGGKFSLISPDHCPGKVVYWTQTPAVAAVPMRVDSGGHPIITVTLDGKEMDAAVDTGSDRSTITLGMAKELFGIDEKDPKLTFVSNVRVNGTAAAALYRYPFAALNLEGVVVQNPSIDILAGKRFEAGDNQMILGIKTLRQLHMYIAYKEKKIYFTPAEAR